MQSRQWLECAVLARTIKPDMSVFTRLSHRMVTDGTSNGSKQCGMAVLQVPGELPPALLIVGCQMLHIVYKLMTCHRSRVQFYIQCR